MRGYTDHVRRIQMLPCQRCVITGCADGNLRVYSIADGSLVRRIPAHAASKSMGVSCLAVLGGRVVVSCGANDG